MIDAILITVAAASFGAYSWLVSKQVSSLYKQTKDLAQNAQDLEQRLEILNKWVDKLSVDNIKSIRSIDALKSTLDSVIKEEELKQRIADVEKQHKYYGTLLKELKSR